MGSVVMFLSPLENPEDKFRENLNVVIQDLSSQPLSLDEFTKFSLEQLDQIITMFRIEESVTDATLDGNPARKIVFNSVMGKYNLKTMQVWAIKGNEAYVLTYAAQSSKYFNYLSIIEHMVISFKIL